MEIHNRTDDIASSQNELEQYRFGIPITKLINLDRTFEANDIVEFCIFVFMLIYYIPPLILYIQNRKNVFIKYRQPKNVIMVTILSAINSITVPLIRYFKIKCLYSTWVVNSLIFSFNILTFSRYIKTYYMQRLSIFKLKFSEKRTNKSIHNERSRSDIIRISSVKLRDSSILEMNDTMSTLKFSSINKHSSISTSEANDSLGIIDPILYFKSLNSIISKKITIYFVIIPVIMLFVYNIVITITNWNSMNSPCVNEHVMVGTPKLLLNIVIIVSSFFMLYQAYIKQKWDREIKIEYTTFVVVDFICNTIMQLTIRGYLGDFIMEYRVYIFQIFSIVVHLMCVIIPLFKIYMSRFKKEDNAKLTEEEFLSRLSNSTFKAQVRDIAINTFCVENILFFDAYCDLMNMIINYYSKKNNMLTSGNSYSSSDILNKNALNPVLYKQFENVFKPQFEKIYNLYIKEDGIAAINIKSSTIKIIEEQMENNNFSYLMFSQAAEEVSELLYNNIYPRMKF